MISKKNRVLAMISIFAAATGLLVCIGWILDMQVLKSVIPGFSNMKFNTAVFHVIVGAAFYLHATNRPGLLFQTLCILVFSFGLISLSQYVFAYNMGIDQLLVLDKDASTAGARFPGRPSLISCLCFSALALALVTLRSPNERIKRSSVYLFHLVTLVSLIALVGYLYRAPVLYSFSSLTSIALHGAILFFLLSVTASIILSGKGLLTMFTGNGIGNIMARNLFPRLLVLTALLGYLRMVAYRNNWVTPEIGFALYTIAFILVGLYLILLNAKN